MHNILYFGYELYSFLHEVMAFQDMIGFKVNVFITQHKNAYLEMIYHSVGLYIFFFFFSIITKVTEQFLVYLTWLKRKSLLLMSLYILPGH